MIIKGILDPEDAKEAVRFGADGIVVSNHCGRQLDGVLSTAHALPAIAALSDGISPYDGFFLYCKCPTSFYISRAD